MKMTIRSTRIRHSLRAILALALLAVLAIGVRPALAQVPLQVSAGGPYSGAVGSQINMLATVTGGVSPQITWDFGDGTTGTLPPSIGHFYTAPGVYTIVATASDTTTGQIATATTTATVAAAASVTSAVSAGGPYTALPGVPITFSATASTFLNPQFAWNFGDGSTGTGQTLSHAYMTAGTFPVTVTVTDATTAQTATAASVALVGIGAVGGCYAGMTPVTAGCSPAGFTGYPYGYAYPSAPVNPICLSGYNFAYWSYPWSLICP